MITPAELNRLYEAVAGYRLDPERARCLRYNGERFYWYPRNRVCPEDQVVGLYTSGVAYEDFVKDVKWAEEHMKPKKGRMRHKKGWSAAA